MQSVVRLLRNNGGDVTASTLVTTSKRETLSRETYVWHFHFEQTARDGERCEEAAA